MIWHSLLLPLATLLLGAKSGVNRCIVTIFQWLLLKIQPNILLPKSKVPVAQIRRFPVRKRTRQRQFPNTCNYGAELREPFFNWK
jgi:hypothetical protein